MRQTLIELKRKIERYKIIVGDFNIPFIIMDKTTMKTFLKEIKYLLISEAMNNNFQSLQVNHFSEYKIFVTDFLLSPPHSFGAIFL